MAENGCECGDTTNVGAGCGCGTTTAMGAAEGPSRGGCACGSAPTSTTDERAELERMRASIDERLAQLDA